MFLVNGLVYLSKTKYSYVYKHNHIIFLNLNNISQLTSHTLLNNKQANIPFNIYFYKSVIVYLISHIFNNNIPYNLFLINQIITIKVILLVIGRKYLRGEVG